MSRREAPRPFGEYLLTAALGEDALGKVFRAIRLSGEKGFVRLRILESPELAEDPVLDAIQEFGEIHSFLKNPAIARGVQLDAVDGTPFIAWNEESGRTLDVVLEKVRAMSQQVPPEHALLIAEKVATALDHAYNTTVDHERTYHGLVWPGFVCITDDGETRLTGFGLAAGVLPSLEKPRIAEQVAPYVAPEERAGQKVGKNSDVFSVGALLFELLAGHVPSGEDPAAEVRALSRQGDAGLTPEVIAVLRTALSPANERYQSAGELRRELGKLLFSGPYSPSTFNLAVFINHLFGSEIEEEARDRSHESKMEARAATPPKGTMPPPAPPRAPSTVARVPPYPPPAVKPAPATGKPARKPVAFVVAALLIAAVAGALYVVLSAPPRPTAADRQVRPAAVPAAVYTPTALPTPEVPAPTVEMTDAEFQEEVSRRVSQQLKKLEVELRRKDETERASAGAPAGAAPPEQTPEGQVEPEAAGETAAEAAPPSPIPEPVRAAVVPTTAPAPAPTEAPQAPAEETTIAPRIRKVIKPNYPPMALRQRIGGIVILRVLVSETGTPLEVQVLRGVRGGLSEAAAAAVRRWTFEPATRNGTPIQSWTTVPIPFEP